MLFLTKKMRKLVLVIFAAVVGCLLGDIPFCLAEQKLTASDGAADDYFGESVSISGDYAIVGAWADDDNGENCGSAYIFERTGGSWIEVAKLTASDGAADDSFGEAVSISGDYTIVGAWADDDNGENCGSAYIFERTGGSWVEVAKLTASDGAAFDYMGRSVSISGDHVIVGAWADDDKGLGSGSAYIFERIGSSWIEVAKLTASDGATYDFFGRSVSIAGDHAMVGAYFDDDDGENSGSAYVFEHIGTSWIEAAKLTASDGAAEDFFGRSVSIADDHAIVGADGDDDNGKDSGSVYVFQRAGGSSWIEVTKVTASDGAADDFFGLSASISGHDAIVGADGDDDNGPFSGSAYVFPIPHICECALTPDTTVVPRGHTLGFEATVTNNTDKTGTVLFVTKITLPDGRIYPSPGYLVGPIQVYVTPYVSKSKHIWHNIPPYAQLGTYTYRGYVGNPGPVIYHECQFDFEVVVPPPPAAEFSAAPTSGYAPLTVDFSDQSTGDVTSWSWVFGDGGTSTAQHPSHTYSVPSSYTVSLTVTGPGGNDMETKDAYITVVAPPPPPVAEFSATPTSGYAPLTVDFSDQSTGDVTSWSWVFGDGGTSTAQNPSYTYDLPSSYTVSLTVTGPGGSHTETKDAFIMVSAAP